LPYNPGDIRASHTIRIFGTNKNDEVLQDIWLDIERIDVYRVSTQRNGRFQGMFRRLYWLDDPTDPEYTGRGNQARVEGTLRICSPDEEDQENPEQWVPVRTIIEMRWNKSAEHNQVRVVRGNRTDAENLARAVAARRCFHRDTTIDKDVDAATAGHPDLKAYVVPSDKYAFVEDSEDKDNYLEVQYASYTRDMASRENGHNQGVDLILKNSHYLRFTDEAKGPNNPVHGFDPPWALDPFQAIVNVQWSSLEEAVLGIASPPGDRVNSTTETSEDGLEWEAGFDGAISSNAATGLGKTVVCKAEKFIAYGKPRNGDACFITASDDTVQRGVLDPEGELTWVTVATLPGFVADHFVGARSCSFAGGAFFVSYLRDNDAADVSYLAVSFDGETFQLGVNPFPGVVAAANGTGMDGDEHPSPVGGNVAYDKTNEVYVTTGGYNRSYWNQQNIGAGETTPTRFTDNNFMSASSDNGTSWTAQFDTSECSGFPPTAPGGIGSGGSRSGVTFGNGLFVAATSFKLAYDFPSSPTFVPYKLTAYAGAVATSTNGTTWVNQRLPGTASAGWVYGALVSAGGNAVATRFFKAKKNASGVPGFFVATAFESVSGGTVAQSKLWQSENGTTWALVRTDAGKNGWILSAINKSRGTIVHRD